MLKDAQAYKLRKAQQQAESQPQNGGSSPVARSRAISPEADASGAQEEEKTAEQKAEEKKKVDVMRKFYRNRHSSLLQALAE